MVTSNLKAVWASIMYTCAVSDYPQFKIPDQMFTSYKGETQEVKMRRITGNMDIFDGSDFEAVSCPILNDRYVFTIFLPNEGKDLTEVINNIDKNIWRQIFSESNKQDLNLELPVFSVCDHTFGMDLINRLSGKEISDKLTLDAIEIDSPGDLSVVSATSFTCPKVLYTTDGPVIESNSYRTLSINRPFIYTVHEKQTGMITVWGILLNPRWEYCIQPE